jgi:hypothetical protein
MPEPVASCTEATQTQTVANRRTHSVRHVLRLVALQLWVFTLACPTAIGFEIGRDWIQTCWRLERAFKKGG